MAGGSTTTPIRYDLSQFATVSRVIDSTHFVATGLSMFPSGSFVGYSVWVLSKANLSITAPKGDTPVAVSQFYGSTEVTPLIPGTVVHAAFSSPLVVGDSILLLHPSVAAATSLQNIAPDGVYLDVVNGVAGTDWPIGTPGMPSLTLADALAIMTARGLTKLYLAGAGAINFTADATLELVGNGLYGITVSGAANVTFASDLECGPLTNTGTGVIVVTGDCQLSDNLQNSGGGQIYIYGNCQVGQHVTNSGGGDITIRGKLDINGDPGAGEGYLDNTGGGNITITGDCYIAGVLTNPAAAITIYGALRCGNNIINGGTLTTGPLECVVLSNEDVNPVLINGDCKTTDTIVNSGGGTITIMGKLDSAGNLDNTGGGDITVVSDCVIGGVTNPTAAIIISGALRCIEITNAGTLTTGPLECGGSLENTGANLVLVYGDCQIGGYVINSGGGEISIYGKLDINGGGLDNTGGGDVVVGGDAYVSNAMTNPAAAIIISGTLRCGDIVNDGSLDFGALETFGLTNSGPNPVTILGDCQIGGYVINSGGGNITINGKLDINGDPGAGEGYLDNTGGGAFFVGGDCHVAENITNTEGAMSFQQNLSCQGLQQADPTQVGTIYVAGDCFANGLSSTGSDGFTIHGNVDCVSISSSLDGISISRNCSAASGITCAATGGVTIGGNCLAGAISVVDGAFSCLNLQTGGIVSVAGSTGTIQATKCQAGIIANNGDVSITVDDCQASNLTNVGAGIVTINGNLEIAFQAGAGGDIDNTGTILVSGDVFVPGVLNNTAAATITITGALRCMGTITNAGTLSTGPLECGGALENTDVNPVTVNGDCKIGQNVLNSGGGDIDILGKLDTAGSLDNTGGGDIAVGGDTYIASNLANPAATITIFGALRCMGTITNGGTLTTGPLECRSLQNTDVNTVTINGDCKVATEVENSGGGGIGINGSLYSGSYLDNTGGGDIEISGDAYISGDLTNPAAHIAIYGALRCMGQITNGGTLRTGPLECGGSLNSTDVNPVTVFGDCKVVDGIVNSGGGEIYIYGKLDISIGIGLDNSGGGNITITGDCYISGDLTNPAATITIFGALRCMGVITNGGTLECGPLECGILGNTDVNTVAINGDCQVSSGHVTNSGGGDITIRGKLDINGDPGAGEGYLDNTGGGDIVVAGDVYIALNLTNPAATVTITGALRCMGVITNGGTLTVGIWDRTNGSVVLAAADLTGTTTRFTVQGPVRVNRLGFLVTTLIPAGANTLKFSFTPTGGAATDLCGATDTAGAAAQQGFLVEGTKATVLTKTTDVGIRAAGQPSNMPIELSSGVIQTIFSAGPPLTGAGTVFIEYTPLAPGAMVY